MNHETIAAYIADGKAVLGIEFGSTRIKAVLIGDDHAPIASGDHTWENRLEDGIWTYHLDDVWAGVQDAFANLQKDVQANYGVTLTNLAAFGVSGMMHGFLAFDENGQQLAQFRTWRNTMTAQAAEKLTALLGFNIPQRWSIAHLVQAMMNGEAIVPQIHHLTTLAGYVHYKLCGKNCLGIGEASGMFPIDSDALDYDQHMLDKVDALAKTYHMPWTLREILPSVLCAGEDAGVMTAEGAKLLDLDGNIVEGKLNPSSDTKTHLELYKQYPDIGGIVHTHSPYAVGWAQACEDIPCYGTTHADYFYGAIPCARHLTTEEIDEDYEKNTGKVIIEELTKRNINPVHVPGIICASHGPFTWGKDAAQAVYHAVVLEEVAKMAVYTRQIKPDAAPAPQNIQDKHFLRKHGPNAYYGQK